MVKSRNPHQEVEASGSRRRLPRTYFKYAVAVLAAFGILGAIGSRVVEKVSSSAGEALDPEAPVLINVREDPQCAAGCVFSVATRSSADLDVKVATVKGCGSLFSAMKAAGAVDVGAVMEGAVLEGGTRRDLTIVGLRAKVLKREPGFDGALAYCAPAGDVGAIGVIFNLDEEEPVARKLPAPGNLAYGEPYFDRGNVIRLVKGEIQPFMLVGLTTRREYVEWEVEAQVVIDGNEQTITINDRGKPFRVTGVAPRYRPMSGYKRYYDWQYYEQPQKLWADSRPSGPYCPMPSPYDC